jgi:hypothetical protein
MSVVNDLLFEEFKQFKTNYYGALMRCVTHLTNADSYYACTDEVQQK